MHIPELLVWIFSAYLALTGAIADVATLGLSRLGLHVSIPENARFAWELDDGTPAPTELPSRFNNFEIARILLDNLDYQEATVAGAGSSRDLERDADPIPDALVNILCTYTTEDETRTTTGSGVFIDPRGIVLTNAHVAQFLLLGDTPEAATCVLRQGSPAEERYIADLLYLSPTWLHANAAQVDAATPQGTGERDYALLYVTDAISGDLPDTFPALTFETKNMGSSELRESVIAAGYPADDFRRNGPDAPLRSKMSTTNITDVYTFGTGAADLIAIAPSDVGEQGASGGPIVDTDGSVIGLIVTRGNDARSLRAITTAHINTTIKEETGFDLPTTLEGNLKKRSQIFKEALLPFLARTLSAELEN